MTTSELVALFFAIVTPIGGGLWAMFLALMTELKSQTATLATLVVRLSTFEVTLQDHEMRLTRLEDDARRQSGIRSVEINKAVGDVAKTLETKTNGGTEYPNRTSDYSNPSKR